MKRLIPNLLTAGNLVGGIFAIIFTLNGHMEWAPYCIFLSAIFDFLDGFVARLLKVQSELGKQLDSLADMVTFGVAPGIIVYKLLNGPGTHSYIHLITNKIFYDYEWSIGEKYEWIGEYLPYIAFLIPVFALFRLAKFNLDTRQTSSFIGLPTPAMTLFFAVIPLLMLEAIMGQGKMEVQFVNIIANPIFLILATIVLSLLMVSEIPLFSLKFKDFKFKGNEIRYLFLTISLLLFATLFFWSIPIIIILYIILSLINNAVKRKNEV
ncbi:CDP-diacylglycerol--serine O-phosphatidyltransferase [Putridiphycobacter roseus]|uniref:CDP-diacylglycerol--serine O-phosphatidyltransferase n=1 Tax=Putridiphycobacter roseus TaxID=2219161 RepID=A0A2W1MZS9_9FLAO|nr:CDP-diacylglycerol--serine O-phosphatidyltransferase [Putridiphycobacter roseus]